MNLILHTERLTLRPLVETDVDFVVELFTDPVVRRFTGGPQAAEKIRIEMPITTRRGGNGCIGVWCACDKETGEQLGTGALLPMPTERNETDWDLVVPGQMPNADIEIGYFLKPAVWGRGFATEIASRLVGFAFSGSPLHEVVATFDPSHHSSRNVLLKSGFRDRGTRVCYGQDSPYFRVTRDEWLADHE